MCMHHLLRVYESEPVCVESSERHVGPHVAVHDVGSHVQRNEDHEHRVGDRPVVTASMKTKSESKMKVRSCNCEHENTIRKQNESKGFFDPC